MKMNIVFTLPGRTDDYQSEAGPLSNFYMALLDMTALRKDWIVIGGSREAEPHLAFGDGPGRKEMPRWPDPAYPSQLHLDIAVPRLAPAADLALGLGARLLDERGQLYADPVGHPFCLYRDAVEAPRIGRIVVDCPEPPSLAAFYAELLDMPIRRLDTADRVVIGQEPGGGGPSLPDLAFQRVAEYRAPRWPDPEHPQQIHLDIWPDRALAPDRVKELGATALPALGGSCPVYADPAGHPFCLCGGGR